MIKQQSPPQDAEVSGLISSVSVLAEFFIVSIQSNCKLEPFFWHIRLVVGMADSDCLEEFILISILDDEVQVQRRVKVKNNALNFSPYYQMQRACVETTLCK